MFSIDFLLTSLVVVLIPGTGVIYTVSNGLFGGWKASIAAAIGCTLGIVPHLLACILGLSAVLHMSAVVFQAMKYVGGLYLLYLAWGMWRDKSSLQFSSPEEEKKGFYGIGLRGFLINILNPKLSIFFFAFLPLFVDQSSALAPLFQLVAMSVIFMLLTFIVFVG